jgi:hypothetical protein
MMVSKVGLIVSRYLEVQYESCRFQDVTSIHLKVSDKQHNPSFIELGSNYSVMFVIPCIQHQISLDTYVSSHTRLK